MNVRVDTEDLRSDAQQWQSFSADPFTPTANKVARLTMPSGALPGAALNAGVDDAYENVRAAVEALVDGGPEAFTTIASTLRTAAQIYEDTDFQSEIDFDRA